jgi:hypothetical protein
MADIRTLKLALLADTKDFIQGLDKANNESRSFSDKLGGALKKGAIAFAALGAAAGAAAIKIGIDAIGAASDFSEEISKSTELFGAAQKGVQDFAEQAAKKLGQTRQEALSAANNFAIFGKAAGLGGKELETFSTDFVALASDLASFNNTSPEEALNAINSALRGEAEPIRKYGVLLNDASLKQEALALGLIKTTKQALTPQQKVLAAQAAIYKQTADAQGDFERTSGGLANKQRILKATIEDLKIELGTALLPIALEVFTFFADKVVPIIEKVVKVVTDLAKTIDLDFGKSLKDAQSRFEPVLNGLRKGVSFVTDAFQRNKEKLQPLLDLFVAFYKFAQEFLIPILAQGLGGALKIIGFIIGGTIDIIGTLVKAIDDIIKRIDSFIEKITNALSRVKEFFSVSDTDFSPASGIASARGLGTQPTIVNNYNIKTAVDPQATARAITKVTNSAFKTTGISFIRPQFR